MNKTLLFTYLCLFCNIYLQGQTTIVYNINNNSCAGSNMNCEGFVNSVGDLIAWDTSNSQVVTHLTFTEPKTITLDFKTSKNSKLIHTFVPSTGASKGKRIRVLFCLIPFNANYSKLKLPDKVAIEVKNIIKEQKDNGISSIIKVYRQFTGDNNAPDVSEWVELATLLIPKTSTEKQRITLNPDATAVATAQNDAGEKVELVIDLQKEY
ncbi:hypothetical protein EKK58_01770 [Candidatus Dependentiae bacterium]|nr:MAG: hypothetical protein EKK58_01770 [Candidatus Dependentiae bacterium]